VDFIIEKEGKIKVYEIKCKKQIKKRELSNLFYFKKLYPQAQFF
jgi:hypothetical protein